MKLHPKDVPWENMALAPTNVGQAVAVQLVLLPLWIIVLQKFLDWNMFNIVLGMAIYGLAGIVILQAMKNRIRQKVRYEENENKETGGT